MSELYDRIIAERGAMPKIVERIPGFAGYLDLAARRAADRMIREHVAGEIGQRIQRLIASQKRLLDREGGLTYMSAMESARVQWQTFHDRVVSAAPGYSGFFALNRIDAHDLESIYSFDEALIRYTEQFDGALATLDEAIAAEGDVRSAIQGLEKLAVEANEALSLRENVITGVTNK
ncbi:MAG: hypothetical protein SF123_09805 [Chloroflexota bacterium]|nr:hypothetical protein [Chloroflexota bacterium]